MTAAAALAVLTSSAEFFGPRGVPPVGEPVDAPAWTRPCQGIARVTKRIYVARCGWISGRVLWVERDDPDGDGDEHAVVVAGSRLVIVKRRRGASADRLPGPGRRLVAVGKVSSGRYGWPEIVTR